MGERPLLQEFREWPHTRGGATRAKRHTTTANASVSAHDRRATPIYLSAYLFNYLQIAAVSQFGFTVFLQAGTRPAAVVQQSQALAQKGSVCQADSANSAAAAAKQWDGSNGLMDR